jgi:FO synthase
MVSEHRETVEFFPANDIVQCVLREIDGLSAESLMDRSRALRSEGHGRLISFSPKVFIPLTRLCRDVCGYCTFAHPPRPGERAFLTIDEVLAIARAGAAAGCTEALFTLGELPQQRLSLS